MRKRSDRERGIRQTREGEIRQREGSDIQIDRQERSIKQTDKRGLRHTDKKQREIRQADKRERLAIREERQIRQTDKRDRSDR